MLRIRRRDDYEWDVKATWLIEAEPPDHPLHRVGLAYRYRTIDRTIDKSNPPNERDRYVYFDDDERQTEDPGQGVFEAFCRHVEEVHADYLKYNAAMHARHSGWPAPVSLEYPKGTCYTLYGKWVLVPRSYTGTPGSPDSEVA